MQAVSYVQRIIKVRGVAHKTNALDTISDMSLSLRFAPIRVYDVAFILSNANLHMNGVAFAL